MDFQQMDFLSGQLQRNISFEAPPRKLLWIVLIAVLHVLKFGSARFPGNLTVSPNPIPIQFVLKFPEHMLAN